MSPAPAAFSCVVGVGVSSRASADEVADLVATLVGEAGLDLTDIRAIATRSCLTSDPRLNLGPRLVGFSDDELIAASRPTPRSIGIPARVAETAALLAAGHADGDAGGTLVRLARSEHATAALVFAASAQLAEFRRSR